MSRGYGKYRRGGSSHASFHFDNLFKENANKPSAARSAATVGKWGITSFTSIRTSNGLSRSENEKNTSSEGESVPKPKKFFKSRNTEPPDLSSSYKTTADMTYGNVTKKLKIVNEPAEKSPPKSVGRKFFSSKSNSPEKTVLSSNVNNSKRNETKPPIVLRICKGKSQLVNDSDESESTPTPSSTPSTSNATSPRALRDTAQRSPNCRITRSARRSMQQDPSSSPATADTPTEFSLFTSPKQDIELSPQYIPAEKYEMERKAMYDNLLKPNSPSQLFPEDKNTTIEDSGIDYIDNEISAEKDVEENGENEQIEDPVEETKPSESVEPSDEEKTQDTNIKDPIEEIKPSVEEPITKGSIEEEWDTDEDSNSTTPDSEMKTNVTEDSEPLPALPEEQKEKTTEESASETSPPVKLVISKKKGSIFKSRPLVTDVTKKRRALYKHKWSDDKDATQKSNENASSNNTSGSVYDEFSFNDDPLTRVTVGGNSDGEDESVTSIKCTKSDKGFYTVVRNVKKAHQIQEIGEFQEFNDDVEYILDALQDNNPISTRCLSAITLASKCMVPAFRMHVRAHGTVAKFFKALHDATKDQSLGLCTATVMFVLSQDRLNMDLDRDCLELMLNLLESDVSYQQALDVCGLSSAQLEKNKQKVRELCAEIQSQGHAMHLNLDNITVGQLAMETLLSLTSKRAGEWFKEELRELGGLEHIMKTICECCRQVSDYVVSWTDALLDKLRKVDRCLRVLENVTHNNEENQTYLLKYNDGVILDTLVNLYKLCDGEIPLYPVTDITDKESTGTIIREALLVTLKVLINLTHHFSKQSMGSTLIGSRNGIIETSLHLLLQVPHYIPEQKKFELGVLVLMLLINLIQDNDNNKKLLMEAKAPSKLESIYSREESAVEALIAQFYHWEGCAKIAEKRTNAILDGEKDENSGNVAYKSNEEFIEETVAKLLQKAGTHMEYTFLASYIVMLIGFLIMDNKEYQNNVRQFLRGNNFADMVELLKKFFNFMNLTASTEASSVCAIKATEKVIKFLEECDSPPPEEKQSYTECMDLSYTMAH
ncbi:protein wings apart-like isoform X1 [Tribolium madens]|uniref:protein wings apart-like isoform X1 n=1 Tax=Tribolium madens TaxID=41895 RepID=UPI001CF75DC3|nr:protein wings apart-like isoform X1 [Tribolium madens]